MKKLLSVLLSALLLVSLFAGCSSDPAGDSADTPASQKVAILQYMTHSSLDNCTQGVKNALDAAGISYDVQIGSSGSADADCQSYAAQMVAGDYDMIIAVATPAALAAYSAVQSASSNIPVIFCAVSDPVAAGLVQSMDAPGNNCTGTADSFDVAGQVDIIKQLQPDLARLGVIYTTSESNSLSQLERLKEQCSSLGITVVERGITEASELASVSASLVTEVDAITNLTDNNVVENMSIVLEQANSAGIPVYGSEIEQVNKGCLASASIDYVALGERTGQIAMDVLGGQSAASYPVVTVEDSFKVINTDVASQLGIAIPDTLSDVQKVTTSAE